jgi:hypothetical protein
LDGASVVTIIGELEPACVSPHVGMATVDRAAAIGNAKIVLLITSDLPNDKVGAWEASLAFRMACGT